MRTRIGLTAALLVLFFAGLTGLRAEPLTRPDASGTPASRSGAPRGAGVLTAGRPALRVYSDRDGLPQNSTERMAIDSKGYLWVVTREGAAHYNGRVWTAVSMPDRAKSNFPRALLAASDGSMWFGTDGDGIHHYRDGEWAGHYDISTGLPANRVMSFLETSPAGGARELWAGTAQGPARFDGERWAPVPVSAGFPKGVNLGLDETIDASGTSVVWVGAEGGLASLRAGKWTVYEPNIPVPSRIVYGVIETSLIDGRNRVWALTGQGLAYVEGTQLVYTQPETAIGSRPVRDALQTVGPDGLPRLWVATEGAGVAMLEGGEWEFLDAGRGLPSNYALSLMEISSEQGAHGIWIGTMTGLARVRDDGWTSYDAETPLSNKSVVSLVETADGVMWFGTLGSGLHRLERGEWSVLGRKDGLSGDSVFCLLETATPTGDSILWAGTEDGLSRLQAGRWTTVIEKKDLPNGENISCLYESIANDGEKTLWAGTFGGGVIRMRGTERTVFDSRSVLPDNRVEWILETGTETGRRTVWIATNGGLAAFRDGAWSTIGIHAGLPSNEVRSLLETRDAGGVSTLWVGTGGGLAFRRLQDDSAPWSVLSDTTVPALPNNVIYQMKQDARGRIYLFTNRGVTRLTPKTPEGDGAAFDLNRFTIHDGLPSNECNFGASCIDRRGRLWVGTVKGAAMYDPSRERIDNAPKPLHIERAIAMNSGEDDDGRVVRLAGGMSLSHAQDRVAFEYALLCYYGEHETRYRTQLAGYDREPLDWTAQSTREFTNLSAGEYTFLVWGRDYAGNVSGPATLKFTIRPAPWRTWWAYAAYVLLLAGAIYAAFRYRLRTLNRRTALLENRIAERTAQLGEKVGQLEVSERRALDSERRALEASRAKSVFLANMSHELRTPLNAILGFVQLMERTVKRTAEDREHLAIIMRSGEHLLGLINDILSISKIEAGKLTLADTIFQPEKVFQAIQEMISARAGLKGLQVIFTVDPSMPRYVRGDEGKLRQVLINLLGNAVKFTDEGGVTLRARWEDGRGFFEVEDTGHGIAEEEMGQMFEPFVQTQSGMRAVEGTGLGLSISRSFVRLMGGDIAVESKLGKGSLFSFDVVLLAADEYVEPDKGTRPRPARLEDGQPPYRILVVDDSWENRAVLTRMLAPVGFEVREAADGLEAIEIWTVWRPDLIWMDIRMPRLDGYEATREIRERETGSEHPTTIIALTASAFEHDQEASSASGFDDFAAKPIRESEVFDKISERLGARYVFEAPGEAVRAGLSSAASLAKRLALVPVSVRERLTASLVSGDIEEALASVTALAETDESLAAEIRRLVRGYQFDRVLDLMEAARSGQKTAERRE